MHLFNIEEGRNEIYFSFLFLLQLHPINAIILHKVIKTMYGGDYNG